MITLLPARGPGGGLRLGRSRSAIDSPPTERAPTRRKSRRETPSQKRRRRPKNVNMAGLLGGMRLRDAIRPPAENARRPVARCGATFTQAAKQSRIVAARDA